MRARLTTFLAVAALTVAAAPAAAQIGPTLTPTPTPPPAATPTPTPTPTPSPEDIQDEKDRNSKSVKRIYRDFERDGRIDDCDHTEKALKKARRTIADDYAEEYPDFRDALTAALERHRDGKCVEATPTPTPTATATPAPSTGTTPPPASTPAPLPPSTSTPETGNLPDFGNPGGNGGDSGGDGGSKGGSSGGSIQPPGEGDIPEGVLPTPTPTPAPQALPPKLVITRAGTAPSLMAPGALLAIALLGLLISGLIALFAKRTGRLQGVGHAWREAAWRTSGTWSEFTDWLRGGR